MTFFFFFLRSFSFEPALVLDKTALSQGVAKVPINLYAKMRQDLMFNLIVHTMDKKNKFS